MKPTNKSFQSISKPWTTQSTLEHFSKKAKGNSKRKEKARAKQQEAEMDEVHLESISHDFKKVSLGGMDQGNDISLVPQFLARKPEMLHPTAINPYSVMSQVKDPVLSFQNNENMVANCIYYGHMYNNSLMACKVSI